MLHCHLHMAIAGIWCDDGITAASSVAALAARCCKYKHRQSCPSLLNADVTVADWVKPESPPAPEVPSGITTVALLYFIPVLVYIESPLVAPVCGFFDADGNLIKGRA